MFLALKPKETWRTPDKIWLADEIRRVLADFPGLEFGFTQPIEMRVAEMLTGTRGALAVKIFGPDLATLGKLASEVEHALREVSGSEDVFTLRNDGMQYLATRIDPLAAGPGPRIYPAPTR
jgi:cobalt-zinc-cadmium resistance protein CzcA